MGLYHKCREHTAISYWMDTDTDTITVFRTVSIQLDAWLSTM